MKRLDGSKARGEQFIIGMQEATQYEKRWDIFFRWLNKIRDGDFYTAKTTNFGLEQLG